MCLAVPAQVLRCRDEEADVTLHGSVLTVSTLLVPGVEVGNWVLIHAGFAIQRIADRDARATFAVIDDLQGKGDS